MAKLNDNLENAKKQIAQLVKDLEKITKKPAPTFDVNNIKQANAAISTLEAAIDSAVAKAEELEEGFGGIASAIGAALAEMSKTDSAVNRTVKSMRGIKSITQDLANDQSGLVTLSEKELKRKQSKLAALTQEAKSQAEIVAQKYEGLDLDKNGNKLYGAALASRLKSQGVTAKEYNSIQSIIAANKANLKVLDEANNKLAERVEEEKGIQKKLGVTGGLLKGISKIPILGDIFDADAAVKDMEDHLRGGGSATKALSKGFKNAGKQMIDGLTNPANALLGIFTAMIKSLTKADTNAGEYAKSMNMTFEEAANTQMAMGRVANLSGDAALTAEKLLKTNQKVGASLGTNAELNEADLKTMTKLTHQAGFQADELMNIQKLSLGQGKSLKANTKEILGGAKAYARRNKIAVNEKTILKEVNNMSASLKLSLGGSGDAMAKAAVEAKKFGINLEQAESISKGLLNFEQSIEDELSAELLLGKDLNLERARGLALNGDAAGAAAEMLKQVGSAAEFGKLNVIQQESLAKAMNMSREELSKSLIESEALKNIGVESVEAAQKEYETLKEKHGAEKAAKMLGDEALASQFEQQSVQEQMADSTAKMQEIFIMMTPALVAIGQAMGVVADLIGTIMIPVQMLFDFFGKIGKRISGFIGPLGKVGKLLKGLASIAVVFAAYKAYASLATIPILGVPLGIAAAAAVTAAGMGALSSINDGVVDPKGGIVMSGEKGSIQLNKDDSVVAGTDLFGGKKEGSSQPPQGGTDMTAVINAINALAARPINVQVGEDVVVKAAVGNSPNVTGDEMGKNSYQLN